jgi:peptidoglycan/LPS O-acetylase OafA/YrhL
MAELAGATSTRSAATGKASSRYIGGISGLRALAVLSVVLFHVNPAWLPGGFVGVDVFFVISGFVVAHSVSDVRAQSFREYFFWFYRRRFLRILPAIYLYVLVVAALGILFLPTSDVTKFVEVTGIASLFGASNFALLWKAGDYFATSSEYNTFTHTWSLAVEEQYYFLFPFFSYWMIVKPSTKPQLTKLFYVGACLICLLSLASAWYFTHHWREFAFFMLPTRLWELGIGFLLRYQGLRLVRDVTAAGRNAAVAALSALALGALLASLVVTPAGAFPWPGALLPCFATLFGVPARDCPIQKLVIDAVPNVTPNSTPALIDNFRVE